jgi:Tol biopolymer transport system component
LFFVPVCALGAGIPKHSIAFAAEHDGGLHYLELSSGQTHKVVFGQGNVSDLAYSERRQQLAFFASKYHGLPRSLYLLDVNTGRTTVLLNAKANRNELYRPAFEPSGQYLYALNYSNGIFRYSFKLREWSQVRVLGREQLNPQGLSFSKSGRRAAISHDRFAGFLIAQVSDAGLRIEREVLSDFNSVTSPHWLDEEVIVFAGRKQPGLQFVWKINLSSDAVEQLTTAPIAARDFLSLSNDSKSVVFTGTKEDEPLEWRLWKVTLEKSGALPLTKGGKLSSHLFPTFIE